MRVYEYGDLDKPVIMLFPGTCCYWKSNFGHVIGELEKYFHTLIVSYSGFDENENTTFVSEIDETQKIEAYIRENFGGKIYAAYGCSLGGSVVSLLVSRKNIHIDHAIIGSSDMDQAPKWLAKIETAIMMPFFYPFITGKGGKGLKKIFDKKMNQGGDSSEYIKKFVEIMGVDGKTDLSFITKKSMKNQFCTDLYTKVGEHISVPGTVIHVFYAKKMGEKYLERYKRYFNNPDIIPFDLQHEELLLDAKRWTKEVCKACNIVINTY
ncbi:hypothetical protein KQI85_12790 [Falcatimonas sp. MSJ-15]|uniref:hypothetical protein n=1 Tax=Falcatimonas sp. MSJ-15 TaxID=2841515 RepID=UPI001C1252F5|nr:hypothetical protein [Falcatimonas sp. MSJ-15]MBU5471235.1 hypothetical protein [Falcatimonas sp. MSJ-15]